MAVSREKYGRLDFSDGYGWEQTREYLEVGDVADWHMNYEELRLDLSMVARNADEDGEDVVAACKARLSELRQKAETIRRNCGCD